MLSYRSDCRIMKLREVIIITVINKTYKKAKWRMLYLGTVVIKVLTWFKAVRSVILVCGKQLTNIVTSDIRFSSKVC